MTPGQNGVGLIDDAPGDGPRRLSEQSKRLDVSNKMMKTASHTLRTVPPFFGTDPS